MGTQHSGMNAPPNPYLAGLTDGELQTVARDRAELMQVALDAGEYDVAEALVPAVAAVNRELERRVALIAAQGRALAAFLATIDVDVTVPQDKKWGLVHVDFSG